MHSERSGSALSFNILPLSYKGTSQHPKYSNKNISM